MAVNNLKRFHEKKKRGLKPRSLYLDHIIRKSLSSHSRRESHSRSHRDIYVIKVAGSHRVLAQGFRSSLLKMTGGALEERNKNEN